MRSLYLLLMLAALLHPSVGSAGTDLEAQWRAANDDWFAGRDASALQRYEALLDQGLDNAALRYNCGTAALRMEHYGLAIFHLKLAMRADPGADLAADAEANLALAREALLERDRDRIEKGQLAFDESHGLWVTLFTLLPRVPVLILALALAAIFLLSLSMLGLRRLAHLHGAARVVAWAALVPVLLALILAGGRLWADSTLRLAVVTAPEALLREAPNAAARGLPVAEGLEVRLLDEAPDDAGLRAVRIGDEREGWMRVDELGVL